MSHTHGYSKHPLYPRWNSFVQRCSNPSHPSYDSYGGRGIAVEHVWSADNPKGCANFIEWLTEQLTRHPQFKRLQDFEVVRLSREMNFGPLSCTIQKESAGTRIRRTSVLTADRVVALRERRRNDLVISLSELAKEAQVNLGTLCNCLGGHTWSCVNDLSPPVDLSLYSTRAKRMALMTRPVSHSNHHHA